MESKNACRLKALYVLIMMATVMSPLKAHAENATLKSPWLNMVRQKLNTSIFRLVVDHRNGDILVGSYNWIYRLSKNDLSTIDEVRTGPVNESQYCIPFTEHCEYQRELKGNSNQILLINYVS